MIPPKQCETCGADSYFDEYCGAFVCCRCGDHYGLVRCYCGWAASGGNGRAELEEMGETIDPEPDVPDDTPMFYDVYGG